LQGAIRQASSACPREFVDRKPLARLAFTAIGSTLSLLSSLLSSGTNALGRANDPSERSSLPLAPSRSRLCARLRLSAGAFPLARATSARPPSHASRPRDVMENAYTGDVT